MVFVDYYQILEIPRNASNLDIRQAYRRLALRWHPDKNPDIQDEATRKFKRISEAYQVLEDKFRRRDHDYDLSKHPYWNNFTASARPPTPHTARRSSTASRGSAEESSSESETENTNGPSSEKSSTTNDANGGHGAEESSDTNFPSSEEETTETNFDSNSDSAHFDDDATPDFEPPKNSSFKFRNPYDVFDEFFGSKVLSKFCPERESGFGFNLDLTQIEAVDAWPKPPVYYPENDKLRRRVVKKMTVRGVDGSMTTLETKTVTVRENGREMATVSKSFEDGILRTTSIKPITGSQITTFW